MEQCAHNPFLDPPLKNICVLSVLKWQPAVHFPSECMPKVQITFNSQAGIHGAGLVGHVPNWVMDSLYYPWQVSQVGIFKQKQTKSTFVLWFDYFLMLQFIHFGLLICWSNGFYVLQFRIGLSLVSCFIQIWEMKCKSDTITVVCHARQYCKHDDSLKSCLAKWS